MAQGSLGSMVSVTSPKRAAAPVLGSNKRKNNSFQFLERFSIVFGKKREITNRKGRSQPRVPIKTRGKSMFDGLWLQALSPFPLVVSFLDDKGGKGERVWVQGWCKPCKNVADLLTRISNKKTNYLHSTDLPDVYLY